MASRVGAYLDQCQAAAPVNCGAFVLGWLEAVTGIRALEQVRTMPPASWARFVDRSGGLCALFDQVGGSVGATRLARDCDLRPGDVGIVVAGTHPTRERWRPVCSIRTRHGWAVFGRGVLTVSGFPLVEAWRLSDG